MTIAEAWPMRLRDCNTGGGIREVIRELALEYAVADTVAAAALSLAGGAGLDLDWPAAA